jgi:cysteine desulfurase/selenocysteine lyase
VLATMEPVQAYWLARPEGVDLDLSREDELGLREDLGARAYDVFGTANFFNFVPWAAALEFLLEQGIDTVARYDQSLVDRLIGALDGSSYGLISPAKGDGRAAIVVVSSADPGHNVEVYRRLTAAGVDVALRRGNIRLSPHLYNTEPDIDRAVAVLLAG